ncbi:VOC family protein [Pseudomonas syringae]|uniref:VOC family protein n=1 Tax=Pseudomonas pergaminensis TaxID=2853159 RepID=A0ABD7TQ61_9PSED|nr:MULTISPECIES: VOC family protein [Pseudomonas]OPB02758.1 hypothetical protein BFW91_26350 [Pseudomonas fluorescens]USW03715.1 VOC family protein [Pseudomonas pergaminensis]
MKLNHINLCSSDVTALSAFLNRFFDYEILQAGKAPAPAGSSKSEYEYAMLEGSDQSFIVITEILSPIQPAYPTNFHFGIIMDTALKVHEKHLEMSEAGFHPEEISNGFEVLGVQWTAFYCPIGDGMKIEVNHRTGPAAFRGSVTGH